jgi:hypothetical protein
VECRYKVRRELVLDRRVLNFLVFATRVHFWFLEVLDPFESNTLRTPPEVPCNRLGDGLGQDVEQCEVFRNDVEG